MPCRHAMVVVRCTSSRSFQRFGRKLQRWLCCGRAASNCRAGGLCLDVRCCLQVRARLELLLYIAHVPICVLPHAGGTRSLFLSFSTSLSLSLSLSLSIVSLCLSHTHPIAYASLHCFGIVRYDEVARDSNGRFVPIDHPEAEAGDDPGIILPEH